MPITLPQNPLLSPPIPSAPQPEPPTKTQISLSHFPTEIPSGARWSLQDEVQSLAWLPRPRAGWLLLTSSVSFLTCPPPHPTPHSSLNKATAAVSSLHFHQPYPRRRPFVPPHPLLPFWLTPFGPLLHHLAGVLFWAPLVPVLPSIPWLPVTPCRDL